MSGPAGVALVGYGRFGRALGELARRAGLTLKAFDPGAEIPGRLRAETLAEALSGAEIVVPAVPLDALPGVLSSLAPLLAPGQLVVEVSSVKVAPRALLSRALGAAAEWAATHPLFGPASVDAPTRRVIVCPDPLRPRAAARARAFYERLGCRVGELSAEAHDALMAETQAIAFFLGEALRSAGLGRPEEWATPSAEALSSLAGGVTGEGGHVREAILARNAAAAGPRRRLLKAAAGLDLALAGAGPSPVEEPAAALAALRGEIDALDETLLALLAKRAEIARAISLAKAALGRPVRDPAREESALEERRRSGAALGLPPAFVDRIFYAILEWSRALQEDARVTSPPPAKAGDQERG